MSHGRLWRSWIHLIGSGPVLTGTPSPVLTSTPTIGLPLSDAVRAASIAPLRLTLMRADCWPRVSEGQGTFVRGLPGLRRGGAPLGAVLRVSYRIGSVTGEQVDVAECRPAGKAGGPEPRGGCACRARWPRGGRGRQECLLERAGPHVGVPHAVGGACRARHRAVVADLVDVRPAAGVGQVRHRQGQ